MRNLVTNPSQVVANIIRFVDELESYPHLKARLGHVHSWYALRRDHDGWSFAPSKFVGYAENTAGEYLKNSRKDADGRQTEKVLEKWFAPVDLDSRLGRELAAALAEFLGQWGRTPRRGVRISVVSEESAEPMAAEPHPDGLLERISSNPEICGGRPCIRGTRVRVSDIVDMMAHGATAADILDDYPYLSGDDIRAALAHAARSADHRIIRAA